MNEVTLMLGQSNRGTINELGRRQAVALAHALHPDAYAKNAYELVYSSDLTRALDTAKIIVSKVGGKIFPDVRLRERYFGDLRDGELYRAQFKAQLWEYARQLQGSEKSSGGSLADFKVPPNGESETDVRSRLVDFFENRLLPDLEESGNLDGSVLIVAHDYVVRIFSEYLLGFEASSASAPASVASGGGGNVAAKIFGAEVPPASISEFKVTYKLGTPELITKVTVVKSADTAHLKGLI